jgi:hypothetical protein
MKKALTAVFAFALLAGAAAGCTDSNQSGKVGERPNRDQPPAASPSTDMGSSPGSASGGSTSPAGSPTDATRTTPPTR